MVFRATESLGPIAAIAAIYLITALFTELITNNAAAVLIFPLAIAVAETFGVNPRPFAMTVAFAASARWGEVSVPSAFLSSFSSGSSFWSVVWPPRVHLNPSLKP